MPDPLYADLETYSEVPIKHGTHAYAEGAEVMLFPYAIGDGEVQCWDLTTGEPMPDDLRSSLMNQLVQTVWHNGGMFDLTILQHTRPDGLALPHSRVFDTMVCAYAHSLPGALGLLCEVLGVHSDLAKDKNGKKLIQLFCKPRPKGNKIRRATRETHPEEWQQFIEYAKADITAMREVYKKLPRWNYNPAAAEGTAARAEYDLWLLDQRINSRGVAVDLALARGAILAAERAKDTLASRAQVLTSGEVASATQRDVMLEHIFAEYGVHLPNMQMDTLERRIVDPELPAALRELLQVRLQATSTSVRKYETLVNATSKDGRLRGLLQFCGAARTGRWSGRTFQPQNLPRPTLRPKDVDFAIEVIKADACELFYADTMQVLSSAIRGCLVAPGGRKLVVADLANIEGRVAAWLAGEQWKWKAFEEYDEGTGPDLYVVSYAKSFGVKDEVVIDNKENGDGTMRQIGKVQELMFQYEGGVGAYVTGAATYRIDLDDMAKKALPTLPEWTYQEACEFLIWSIKEKRGTQGLSEEVFKVCNALKSLWRRAHPEIASYWGELKQAYVDAVAHPGTNHKVRMLTFRRDGAWLRIKLPSGRFLCYPSPKVEDGVCSYLGLDQYTKKWQRQYTYGGKLFENICQAVARDVMAYSMLPVEEAGYEIALTVHDELITEAPDTDDFNAAGLGAILSAGCAWSEGLPLAAAGFEAYRYKKE